MHDLSRSRVDSVVYVTATLSDNVRAHRRFWLGELRRERSSEDVRPNTHLFRPSGSPDHFWEESLAGKGLGVVP